MKKTYTIVVTRGLTSGIEDSFDNPLVAYPNPAREQIVVSGLNGNGILTVFDIAGRQLIKRNITASEEVISIHDVTPGSYLILVNERKQMRTIKIIVE